MIPLSPLQLKNHFFPVVNVRANESGKMDGHVALNQHVEYVPIDGKPNFWHLELFLNQRSVDSKKPFYYEIELHVVGVVEVSEKITKDKIEPIAAINGLSMLYGAAREMILNVTARSAHGAFSLPSLSFAEVLKQAKAGPTPTAEQQLATPAAKVV